MQSDHIRSFQRACRAFVRRTDGTATVEAVLWLPMFLILLGMFVDVITIFSGQGRIMTLIQETNRALSVGRFADADVAEGFLTRELAQISLNANSTVTVSGGRIVTTVNAPLTDLDAVGVVGAFQGSVMTLRAAQLVEY